MSVGANEYSIAISTPQSTAEVSVDFTWPASYTELVAEVCAVGEHGEVEQVAVESGDVVDNGDGTYTLTVDNPWPGSEVVLVAARQKDVTQEVNLVEAIALDPDGVDAQLDAFARFIQEDRVELARRPRVLDPDDTFTIPGKDFRQDCALAFDSAGDLTMVELPTPGVIGDMIRSYYDEDGDGVVDAAEVIVGQGALATKSTVSNSDWSGTDLAVANGGTGASTAEAARSNLGAASAADLTAHTGSSSNPHSVTKSQVGLGSVANALQLQAANNLSDLASAATARSNLGLGSAALSAATDFAAASHTHSASAIASGTLDGDRLPAMSATKAGAVPATGTPSGKYLKDDGTWGIGGAGVSDHGGLSGLADDDHPQYLQKQSANDLQFTDGAKGVVFKDRTTGALMRLYLTNGVLKTETVTE